MKKVFIAVALLAIVQFACIDIAQAQLTSFPGMAANKQPR